MRSAEKNLDVITKSQLAQDDPFARERRLRRLATKRGFTLVRPWGGERRNVGSSGFACYVLCFMWQRNQITTPETSAFRFIADIADLTLKVC
jgi:hypothetical protein